MAEMSEVERRAYRDGQIDAKLQEHAAHLKAINGSQERTAAAIEAQNRSLDKLTDQMTGLLLTVPKLQTVAEQVEKAEQIDAALRQKRIEDSTFWDRNRALVAWALGIVAVTTATGTTWLHLFGVG